MDFRRKVDQDGLPLVSVHIITYNQEDLIGETLDSVLNQTFHDYEIIVSDDASTDRTPQIISEYAERYPRIRPLLHSDNVGITGNSNRGLRACRGKYIAFMGGDDLLCPDKLERQVRWFEERDERVLCGHQVEVFYDNGFEKPHRFQRILRSGRGAAKLIRFGSFAACSVMVRADRLPAHGFEESLPTVSDYMLWVETLADGGEYGYISGVHARYRRHGSNISRNAEKMTADAIVALNLIERRYPQYRESCRRAYGRFVNYPRAVAFLEAGNRPSARQELYKSLKTDVTFFQGWRILMKSFGL